jgi:hypothetical protein
MYAALAAAPFGPVFVFLATSCRCCQNRAFYVRHRRWQGSHAMIALLFAMIAGAMGLAWYNRLKAAFAVFGVAIVVSVYWLNFHATSVLTIQL